mmetsp:Transcript_78687/g.139000  ORF Transcript_78687/g.139000 Transcript_78687/m.139000 type:complete len:200 (+) Transcript_78687:787-1386(+)
MGKSCSCTIERKLLRSCCRMQYSSCRWTGALRRTALASLSAGPWGLYLTEAGPGTSDHGPRPASASSSSSPLSSQPLIIDRSLWPKRSSAMDCHSKVSFVRAASLSSSQSHVGMGPRLDGAWPDVCGDGAAASSSSPSQCCSATRSHWASSPRHTASLAALIRATLARAKTPRHRRCSSTTEPILSSSVTSTLRFSYSL